LLTAVALNIVSLLLVVVVYFGLLTRPTFYFRSFWKAAVVTGDLKLFQVLEVARLDFSSLPSGVCLF
jgi:hypothetical protein